MFTIKHIRKALLAICVVLFCSSAGQLFIYAQEVMPEQAVKDAVKVEEFSQARAVFFNAHWDTLEGAVVQLNNEALAAHQALSYSRFTVFRRLFDKNPSAFEAWVEALNLEDQALQDELTRKFPEIKEYKETTSPMVAEYNATIDASLKKFQASKTAAFNNFIAAYNDINEEFKPLIEMSEQLRESVDRYKNDLVSSTTEYYQDWRWYAAVALMGSLAFLIFRFGFR